MQPSGHWRTFYENSFYCFRDHAFYALGGIIVLGYSLLWKFSIFFLVSLILNTPAFFFSFKFQGTPHIAKHIPFQVLFAPLFLLQGAGVLFAAFRLVEKIILLLRSGAVSGRYFAVASKARDFLGFLHHGSR